MGVAADGARPTMAGFRASGPLGSAGRGGCTMGVYGGLEYTEGGTTYLTSYPGTGTPGAVIAPEATATIDNVAIGFYRVADGDMAALAGDPRAEDWELLHDGRVHLKNDTITAEWVIEGHRTDGLSVDAMMANVKQDIARLIALREQLRSTVDALKKGHAESDHILIAPAGAVDLRVPGPNGLFEYRPDKQVFGGAQLTVQYENVQTITRIALLNASRWLPGKKVALGDDAGMVANTLAPSKQAQYTSFASAQTLLEGLTDIAGAVTGGGTTLTKAQVALVMLMVLNDATAATMRRFDAPIGQTDDKNLQRFFPKSRRNLYVNAVAQAAVPAAALGELRTE